MVCKGYKGLQITAYVRTNASRTNERVMHFGEALGARIEAREHPVECDLAIQAGFQISPAMADAMNRGIPYIILENPVWHYGDKCATYTYGYNGLNGLSTGYMDDISTSRPCPTLGPDRSGEAEGATIICGQVPTDKAIRGEDYPGWLRGALETYPEAEYREHPVMLNARQKSSQEPLQACLDRSKHIVTFNSTVGAEALIQGLRSTVAHPGSWAYGVTDKEQWLRELSWRHWSTNEEIDVEHILNGYEYAAMRARAGNYDNMSNGRDY